MRFLLTLQVLNQPANLPANYQYPFSAAIYKILQQADEDFAKFLHNEGYGNDNKSFKLFTFSDVFTPFTMQGDRMKLLADKAKVNICFYIPNVAEQFIKGVFLNREIEIADKQSKVIFQVLQVEVADPVLAAANIQTVILHPISPVVVGIKNEKGNYTYLDPFEPEFLDSILFNLLQKYKVIKECDDSELLKIKSQLNIVMKLFSNPPQQRLITIKAGTPAETKIRGYKKFRLQLTAPLEIIKIALSAGIGLYNAQGMGCVEVIQ